MTMSSEVIAMERAALDRSDKGDPNGFVEISDPEVVYIDPSIDQPIYGLPALKEYYRGFQNAGGRSGEMLNVTTLTAGDAIVLTFNYRNQSQPGQPALLWNATEVYRRAGNSWRIIHTHWSLVKSGQV